MALWFVQMMICRVSIFFKKQRWPVYEGGGWTCTFGYYLNLFGRSKNLTTAFGLENKCFIKSQGKKYIQAKH